MQAYWARKQTSARSKVEFPSTTIDLAGTQTPNRYPTQIGHTHVGVAPQSMSEWQPLCWEPLSYAFTDSGIEAVAIANSPFLTQLEFLSVRWLDIGEEAVTALANSPNIKNIKTFEYLSFDQEDRHFYQILLDSPYLTEEARQAILKQMQA